jgi:hypothetical protein
MIGQDKTKPGYLPEKGWAAPARRTQKKKGKREKGRGKGKGVFALFRKTIEITWVWTPRIWITSTYCAMHP